MKKLFTERHGQVKPRVSETLDETTRNALPACCKRTQADGLCRPLVLAIWKACARSFAKHSAAKKSVCTNDKRPACPAIFSRGVPPISDGTRRRIHILIARKRSFVHTKPGVRPFAGRRPQHQRIGPGFPCSTRRQGACPLARLTWLALDSGCATQSPEL